MKDAFEYFRTNLVAILANYEGEYIAIVEDNIVAHGMDAKKVYSSAKEKFPLSRHRKITYRNFNFLQV